jgi:hypothetical protein
VNAKDLLGLTTGYLFIPNPKFWEELDDDDGVRATLTLNAREAASQAAYIGESIGSPGTGAYAESIGSTGPVLFTDDPAGWIIEYGSIHNPPYAPLRKASEAVGARFVERGGDFSDSDDA